ncbi:MAG: FKBP-type peptidyl-prolyl cis-trans isomerase [Bacteroidaceae bacterium]|nr:FKBP-type peptidyl-prolyl cis-trans isomerase [Bacteroidaceae bacterium]
MKKITFAVAAIIAAVMVSCGNGTPKADLKNDIDTLSYAIGITQTQGLKDYLQYRMGVDSTYMDEFIKGLNEGANAGDDKKKQAYYAGLQIGQQISQGMIKSINHELFGEDSTQTISLKNFMAGFVCGATDGKGLMTFEEAQQIEDTKMKEVKAKQMEIQYGDWKKKNEAYMDSIAKAGVAKELEKGVYYEVITEGSGIIPADSSMVKVHYEGKLIDGTQFDSSYNNPEPTKFHCNQVIPGWTLALTHMPVGSKWKIYIPAEMAYQDRNAGPIKPFSTLVFTLELLGIE